MKITKKSLKNLDSIQKISQILLPFDKNTRFFKKIYSKREKNMGIKAFTITDHNPFLFKFYRVKRQSKSKLFLFNKPISKNGDIEAENFVLRHLLENGIIFRMYFSEFDSVYLMEKFNISIKSLKFSEYYTVFSERLKDFNSKWKASNQINKLNKNPDFEFRELAPKDFKLVKELENNWRAYKKELGVRLSFLEMVDNAIKEINLKNGGVIKLGAFFKGVLVSYKILIHCFTVNNFHVLAYRPAYFKDNDPILSDFSSQDMEILQRLRKKIGKIFYYYTLNFISRNYSNALFLFWSYGGGTMDKWKMNLNKNKVEWFESQELNSPKIKEITTMEEYKVLVTGQRDYKDYANIRWIISDLYNRHKNLVIINGKGKGADELSTQAAIEFGIPYREYPADWNKHGPAAGPIRNVEMYDKEDPDIVLAFFHNEYSKGTRHCVLEGKRRNKKVHIFGLSKAQQKRVLQERGTSKKLSGFL